MYNTRHAVPATPPHCCRLLTIALLAQYAITTSPLLSESYSHCITLPCSTLGARPARPRHQARPGSVDRILTSGRHTARAAGRSDPQVQLGPMSVRSRHQDFPSWAQSFPLPKERTGQFFSTCGAYSDGWTQGSGTTVTLDTPIIDYQYFHLCK